MNITAKQIADWSKTKAAQPELPRLIRRLISNTATITSLSVPSGDSTSQPGFDGEIHSETGSAWVPQGYSVWELSCNQKPTTKANDDYNKRLLSTDPEFRKVRTYVALNAAKWNAKKKWREDKAGTGEWQDVRAYDADDIEAWLEQTPAVALQFAEELGISGEGVESLDKCWKDWSVQVDPAIKFEAFLAGREDFTSKLSDVLAGHAKSGQGAVVTISADSVGEAVAFVCGYLKQNTNFSSNALVVTTESGWRFVEKNANLTLAIAARPELAEKPTQRSGLVVVIPYAAGDFGGHFKGVASKLDGPELNLERPFLETFEKSLQEIGLNESDAEKFARTTGRSWSVFRRRRATNPAIRRPSWLAQPASKSLSTLCLLGGWSASNQEDISRVAQIAGYDYEKLERDLKELAKLDDAPVLHVGKVWKAKSALELMDLYGDRLTDQELDRYFSVCEEILSTPDPELELPAEERYMSQIHGKNRPNSGFFLKSLCDTLIKLAVRGSDFEPLVARNITARVSSLVHKLLFEADAIRWLSLAGHLPALAEAAPREFLVCVEKSLSLQNAPVRKLLEETDSSGVFGGRCWHAGLMWALETIAWSPEHLARTTLVLGRLSETHVKGNWTNGPLNSLVSIYKTWLPQTSANIDQRKAALATFVKQQNENAYELVDKLAHVGQDIGHYNHRPSWRDDAAGSGRGVSGTERDLMLVTAADLQIDLAFGQPERIAKLVPKLWDFDEPRVAKVLQFCKDIASRQGNDQEKEIIRSKFRDILHTERNYGQSRKNKVKQELATYDEIYEALLPDDLAVRHGWLFKDGWPRLPVKMREMDSKASSKIISQYRQNALSEIVQKGGIEAALSFADSIGAGSQVGFTLGGGLIDAESFESWFKSENLHFENDRQSSKLISGFLQSLSRNDMIAVVKSLLQFGNTIGWEASRIARFLTLAPYGREIWSVVEECGAEVENFYWQTCRGYVWRDDNELDFLFHLQKLFDANRPATALEACHSQFKGIEPELLVKMLQGWMRGQETGGPRLESYSIREAIKYLEATNFDKEALARLEFALIPALGFQGEQEAKSLYLAIMNSPELFVELLTLLYRPKNIEKPKEQDESTKQAAETAWKVLHHCKMQPGQNANGTIDIEAFAKFVEEVRLKAQEVDRLEVCDSELGQIFAHAPKDEDGTWPFLPARDALDQIDRDAMRSGFRIGTFNKRGVTSRGIFDGGQQERLLENEYRDFAKIVHNSHPLVAVTLSLIADYYKRDGVAQDAEARLRREGDF